ncbi:Dihydropteroate synthase [Sanghuangporus baumii]|uniref:2-amino-4-hydroxy-6-hydroxymethyldihydropteridine diphosphokinase n=1 Tax=Sanghuangporus baumii TaxID=108892 RepID=A0A9Q5N9Y7_SANBA|nr:Dihydropteroate synthase [Sanghuangporus baumii]
MDDRIRVNGLHLYASVCGSAWSSKDSRDSQRAELQPVIVSIEVHHDLQSACRLDDISHSVDYSRLSKKVRDACSSSSSQGLVPETPYGLAERVLDSCLREINQPIRQFVVELEFPKLVLRAKGAGVRLVWRRDDALVSKRHSFLITELPVHAIVGLREHERKDKQPVLISLELDHAKTGHRDLYFSFSKLERRISEFVEASAYMTIETLAHQIAQDCFATLEDPASFIVTVSLAKPAAITMAQAPEIRIKRSLSDFPLLKIRSRRNSSNKTLAALSLGANLGDRFQNIELALRYLENIRSLAIPDLPAGELTIVDTSFLYESEPMYVEAQPPFVNCACLIETTFTPGDLLRVCKYIEKTVGRVPSERFGPRAIDVDIITFGDQTIDTRALEDRASLDNLEGQLVVPHPRVAEREFVLRPLKDIIPEWVHPQLHLSIRSLLGKLMLAQSSTLDRVIPFPLSPEIHPPAEHQTPATQTYWILPSAHSTSPSSHPKRRYIMATLNATPDSFSDGGEHSAVSDALAYARSAVAAGADIIDVGGYSTRPGAQTITPSEEIARVVPIIHAIRSDADSKLRSIPISIDTFRACVARAALDAGANCINDVHAFSGGPEFYASSSSGDQSGLEKAHFAEMQALARARCAPVVLMHSRGYADKNKDYSSYSYSYSYSLPVGGEERGVVEGVRAELGARVSRALEGAAALRRWQVIVDPGIGFSKDVHGNLQLLRRASELVEEGFSPPGSSASYPNVDLDSNSEGRSSSSSSSSSSSFRNPYTTPNWNPLASYPLLVGSSRKSFLGQLISAPPVPSPPIEDNNKDNNKSNSKNQPLPLPARPPKERDFATAAAIACAVQQGAALVRVHAVQEMRDVVGVAAALWP